MIPIAEAIWRSKYRFAPASAPAEIDVSETWQRVAGAIAVREEERDRWIAAFRSIMSDFLFLPGGRVLAGAGTDKNVTLFNCFVAGPIEDSLDGILESLKETGTTMQMGGGIGCDFSGLRPSGSPAVRTGSIASGPVSFMHIWDALCETLLSTSTRRGAIMGTLRCDHPDIQAFVDAKRRQGALRNFNLSVLVTDAFMQAVEDDGEWQLVYPPPANATAGDRQSDTSVRRSLPARDLWRQITEAAHETAEPGLLFIDNINHNNNLAYCETISATNPCGEIPLPPYGSCNLGSVNLTALVRSPFTKSSDFDWQRLAETVEIATRFLDDVIDVTQFPLEQQAARAHGTRRIGIGVTGLADALAMLGWHYDSDAARDFATSVLEKMRDTAYATSIRLASRKGPFPMLDRDAYLAAPFIRRLPGELRDGIASHGIRNSHLLAIAPAGTISLLAGNVSSGIEPIYALEASRDVREADLTVHQLTVRDFAYARWLVATGGAESVPRTLVTAEELPAEAHLAMQACLQPYVDNAISKTVNLAGDATVDDVAAAFTAAYRLGIKGCTVFRPGTARGQVIRAHEATHCCHIDREAD